MLETEERQDFRVVQSVSVLAGGICTLGFNSRRLQKQTWVSLDAEMKSEQNEGSILSLSITNLHAQLLPLKLRLGSPALRS